MSKFLSRFVQDDLRREGLHLLGIVLGAVCIAFVQFFAWAILSETIQEDPFGLTAILFFASQSVLLLGFLYVALVGFSKEMRISITSEGVIVAVPGRSHTYTWGVIGEVSIIDADVYQKHYRRYRATQLLGAVQSSRVVLMTTKSGPIVIGLPAHENTQFIDAIHSARGLVRTPSDFSPVSV